MNRRLTPISQLISRGLRKAPVKKMRRLWASIAARNSIAAQWCICRTSRPPRMSKEIASVDSNASDICSPRSSWYVPSYSTSAIDGLNQRVKKTPVSSRMMNE